MARELIAFDPAKYLDTPEACAAFITDMIEEGTDEDLRDALALVAEARGFDARAADSGLSRYGIDEALGGGDARLHKLLRVLNELGLRLEVTPGSPEGSTRVP